MSSTRSGSRFKSNPYIVGPPVTGEAFYGREDTFRFVLETLGTPDNRLIVLYGQRRTGKTSLLRELHKNRLQCDQLCPVFIDLQSAPQRPVNQVLHEIALEIAAALGLEKGWDEALGLETEIVPLTRPYGLWTNNLFTGQVLLKGNPAPFAEVEVEYLNESPGNISVIHPPADPYVTQVVKADANGVFSYAMPKSGWWGFAALSEADWTMKHEGQDKDIEIGAVYWVHTRDMK